MLRNRRLLIILLYAAAAIYLLPMYPHGGSANELTRWATAASIVEKGSFEISWTEPLIGPNVDAAIVDGRVYSNKPPGGALLGVPAYAAARLFVGPPTASNIRVTWLAMRLLVSTLPLLLLAFWLYKKGTDEFGLAVLLFATPLAVYGVLLFSHVLAAVLVYAAFRLLYDDGELTGKRLILAGAASGAAVITEFPALFAIAVFGAGLLFTDRVGLAKRVGLFVAGGAPFAGILLIYNKVLFGSALSFSYAHERLPEWAEVASKGVLGIGLPTPSNFYLLLASPSRGLLFFTPLLALSIWAFARSTEKATLRYRVRLAAVVLCFIALCGHGAAHGGWSFGPRYLVFILPLLLDPLLGDERPSAPEWLYGALFCLSLLMTAAGLLTFPFAPPEFTFPHNDFFGAFLFRDGWVVPTLANVIGLGAIFSAALLCVMFGAVGYLVISFRRDIRRFLLGMVTAAVVFAAYVQFPGLADREQARVRRASIAERYFKPQNRLQPERAAANSKRDLSTLRLLNDLEWTVLNARAFAPDDFPYLPATELKPSPAAMLNRAAAAQASGSPDGALSALMEGKTLYPQLSCEFSTSLGILYFSAGKKAQAQVELESASSQVDPASRPDCMKSQYLLALLYRDAGRASDAQRILSVFAQNTQNTPDASIRAIREQLGISN